MRKWIFWGLLAGLAAAAGCTTVTKSPADNAANMRSIVELDMLEMADDFNMIWLLDKQSRLTKWHTR
jgi:hypothetical protein